MENAVVEIQSDRTMPINGDSSISENRGDQAKYQRSKTNAIRIIRVLAVLTVICVIIILAVYWANGDTLLTRFSFQKENIRTPVFVCIEVFLVIVLLVNVADVLRVAFVWLRSKRKYALLNDSDAQFETTIWKGIMALSSQFRLKQSLEKLHIHALAEIGLLTKEACRLAAGARSQDHERQMAVHEDEYCTTLSSGIEGSHALFTSNIVQVAALITGSRNSGKTSIFNRIMYGGFSETKVDTVGFNLGLKTLTVDGPNMFNQRETLKIEIQLVDFSITQEQSYEHLPLAFDSHLVLIVVSDAMDRSSIENVAPLISRLKDKGVNFHATVFVNKVDAADDIHAVRSECYHHLNGVDLLEVSAKTGDGVTEAFINAISKAICTEARIVAQSKRI